MPAATERPNGQEYAAALPTYFWQATMEHVGIVTRSDVHYMLLHWPSGAFQDALSMPANACNIFAVACIDNGIADEQ